MDTQTLQQITVSLALGLLLGLQRQRTDASIGGIRTFPFIALMGTVCAKLAAIYGGWILGAALLALAGLLVFANYVKLQAGKNDPGVTSEIAALLMFADGALIASNQMAAGAVLGGIMVMLLHLKKPMHDFAAAVGDRDMRSMMFFVLISLIILPVLPNERYGPYLVWNPFSIWLMVVLIVAISLSGYVAWKVLGSRAGSVLGGIIGGLISSTATTVSFARRTVADVGLAPMGAFVIMTASCVSLLRIVLEIAAAGPGVFAAVAPPVGVLLAVSSLIALVLYRISSRGETAMPEQKNPAELKPALIFGALYALVLLAVAVARDHFGETGLYAVAALSGLTDVDAITLSSAQLAQRGVLDPSAAWRTILIAAMANFFFKFLTVAFLGSRALTRRVALAFGAALATGGCLFWLWPW